MRVTFSLITLTIIVVIYSMTQSQPNFNGSEPGCGGNSCHTSAEGIVTVEVINSNQIQVTLSGTTRDVAGELVDSNNTVVAVNNGTSANPFILTAPGAGTYTVNAGYSSPRLWESTTVTLAVTGIDDKLIDGAPDEYELSVNYPNPFNPATTIRYALPEASFTTLKIYNIQGEEVMTLVNGERPAGVYELKFDAANLPSGTYIYRLESGSFNESKKMVLMK